MTDISIIVPIYHGMKYIDQMINQVELAAEEYDGETELLFVNDDPEAPILNELFSEKIIIRTYNSEYNCGIHGARVKGLLLSSGKYILFLDQDDKISPAYFKSQMKKLGDADAVVCQIVDNDKIYYNQSMRLEDCIRREAMTQTGNCIVSPGQVLLKREAISAFWTTNLLTCNGADDWFLWICMMCEGREFKVNEELLFWHVKHEENASSDSISMLNSISELYDKLKSNECCTNKDLDGISKIVKDHEIRFIKERDKFLDMYILLDKWMTLWEKGRNISEYFQRKGYKHMAIYGRGRIGIRAAKELMENGINICYFIDRNKQESPGSIKTVTPGELFEIKEPVLITLVKEEAAEVRKVLKQKGTTPVYFIEEVIGILEKTEKGDKNIE